MRACLNMEFFVLILLVLCFGGGALLFRLIRFERHPWRILGTGSLVVFGACVLFGPLNLIHVEIEGWLVGLALVLPLLFALLVCWALNGGRWR